VRSKKGPRPEGAADLRGMEVATSRFLPSGIRKTAENKGSKGSEDWERRRMRGRTVAGPTYFQGCHRLGKGKSIFRNNGSGEVCKNREEEELRGGVLSEKERRNSEGLKEI